MTRSLPVVASSSVNARPERRLRAQHVEHRRRRAREQEALRRPVAGERAPGRREDRETLERRRLLAALEIVGDGGARVLDAHRAIRVVHEHEPVAFGIRQRPQIESVQDAEDRRVRADREREHERDHGRVQRALAERANGVANVFEQELASQESALLRRQRFRRIHGRRAPRGQIARERARRAVSATATRRVSGRIERRCTLVEQRAP